MPNVHAYVSFEVTRHSRDPHAYVVHFSTTDAAPCEWVARPCSNDVVSRNAVFASWDEAVRRALDLIGCPCRIVRFRDVLDPAHASYSVQRLTDKITARMGWISTVVGSLSLSGTYIAHVAQLEAGE